MTRRYLLPLASLSIWLLCITFAQAQAVRDLTDHDPTVEELIQGLKLSTPPPAAGPMRGIGPVTATEAPQPPCEYYRKRTQTRGIQLGAEEPSISLRVTFATNSAQLTPEATQTLDTLGKALQSSELASCCFQIEGHTDSVGGDAYNLALSQRRAQSVVHYLTERYALKDRTVTVGYGEQKPVADNDTEDGRQKNRRVQIVNLGYEKTAEK